MSDFESAYNRTLREGLFEEKIDAAAKRLASCHACPRACGVNRKAGEKGVCRTGENAWVSSYNAHYGEEAPLGGSGG